MFSYRKLLIQNEGEILYFNMFKDSNSVFVSTQSTLTSSLDITITNETYTFDLN